VLVVLLVLTLLAVAWRAWLVRDPEPHFAARRGALVDAVEEERSEVDGHLERLVRLTSTSGLVVELAVKLPLAPAPSGGRPACLLLGGMETGRRALRFVPDTRGAVVAALSYPYDGPRKPKGWAVLGAVADGRAAARDTPPAVQLALDWLLTLPEVDPARVELAGVSLGGPFVCIAGAREPRFRRVWVLHAGGDVPALLDASLRRRIEADLPRSVVVELAWTALGGEPMAPERWIGRIAPRPVVIVGAEDDARVPRHCVEMLHAAAGEPRELDWTRGGHVDTDRERIAQELVERVLARLGKY